MGKDLRYVDPAGTEHKINYTEVAIDDSRADLTMRTWSQAKINQEVTKAKKLEEATGILSVAKGGTGANTSKAAQFNLLNDMQTETSDVIDDTSIVCAYNQPTTGSGMIFKRSAVRLWNYIKSKIESLALTFSGNTTFNGTVSGTGINNLLTYYVKLTGVHIIAESMSEFFTNLFLRVEQISVGGSCVFEGDWAGHAYITGYCINAAGYYSGIVFLWDEAYRIHRDSANRVFYECLATNTFVGNSLDDFKGIKKRVNASSMDLNDLKENGIYYGINEDTAINKPNANDINWIMEVINQEDNTSSRLIQRFHCINSQSFYFRIYNYNTGIWEPWRQLATTDGTVANATNAGHATNSDYSTIASGTDRVTLSGRGDTKMISARNRTIRFSIEVGGDINDVHPVYLNASVVSVGGDPIHDYEYRIVGYTDVYPGRDSPGTHFYPTEPTGWISGDAWKTKSGLSLLTGYDNPPPDSFVNIQWSTTPNPAFNQEKVREYSILHHPIGMFYRGDGYIDPIVEIRLK